MRHTANNYQIVITDPYLSMITLNINKINLSDQKTEWLNGEKKKEKKENEGIEKDIPWE